VISATIAGPNPVAVVRVDVSGVHRRELFPGVPKRLARLRIGVDERLGLETDDHDGVVAVFEGLPVPLLDGRPDSARFPPLRRLLGQSVRHSRVSYRWLRFQYRVRPRRTTVDRSISVDVKIHTADA